MQKMMVSLALTIVLLAGCDAGAQEKKPLKLNKQWNGSVLDEALQKGTPEFITNAKALAALWKAWNIAEKAPEIDFTKELVLVGTTVGSRLSLSARLDAAGDLEVLGLATQDFGPGFRYVLASVNRDGVKTINKKELPK